MADYSKLDITGVYSKSSTYEPRKVSFSPDSYEVTPDEYIHAELQADISAGTTLTTNILSSATLLVVKNNDTTNYVTATFDCAGMGGTNTSVRIHAGGVFVTTDFTVAENLNLAANSAPCECEVLIVGT